MPDMSLDAGGDLWAKVPVADLLKLKSEKEVAYHERNMVVAALSKLLPSHLSRHPDDDIIWDNDWRWIVCVHGPTGQMSWHIHDSELMLFPHLGAKKPWSDYDGHTTEEKYKRLSGILPRNFIPKWRI